MSEEEWMRLAIAKSREGIASGQSPFGSVVVVDRVVFGASITDAASAGFAELRVPAATLASMGGSALIVEGGLLREECAELFEEWKKVGRGGAY